MPTFVTADLSHTWQSRMVIWRCTRYEYSINHNPTPNPKLLYLTHVSGKSCQSRTHCMSTIFSNNSHARKDSLDTRAGLTRLSCGRRFKFAENSRCIVGRTIDQMSFSPLQTPHRTRGSQADVLFFRCSFPFYPTE